MCEECYGDFAPYPFVDPSPIVDDRSCSTTFVYSTGGDRPVTVLQGTVVGAVCYCMISGYNTDGDGSVTVQIQGTILVGMDLLQHNGIQFWELVCN